MYAVLNQWLQAVNKFKVDLIKIKQFRDVDRMRAVASASNPNSWKRG
jgi:hypothetical protein